MILCFFAHLIYKSVIKLVLKLFKELLNRCLVCLHMYFSLTFSKDYAMFFVTNPCDEDFFSLQTNESCPSEENREFELSFRDTERVIKAIDAK